MLTILHCRLLFTIKLWSYGFIQTGTNKYDSIPYQHAKENKKFQYSLIGSNARTSTYEIDLKWLIAAGLVLKCWKTREGKMLLAFYEDI
jgi:hypothetical protein